MRLIGLGLAEPTTLTFCRRFYEFLHLETKISIPETNTDGSRSHGNQEPARWAGSNWTTEPLLKRTQRMKRPSPSIPTMDCPREVLHNDSRLKER